MATTQVFHFNPSMAQVELLELLRGRAERAKLVNGYARR
jgi:hypothetical protein